MVCMAVDRLRLTVPSELGAALRSLAAERNQSVSTVVTEAIAHHVRMDALDWPWPRPIASSVQSRRSW